MKINWFKIDYHILAEEISQIFTTLNYKNLGYLLQYLIIGNFCHDCQNTYDYCKCNICNICKTKYCTCNISSVKNFIVNFIRHNLSTSILKILESEIDSNVNCFITSENLNLEQAKKYRKLIQKMIDELYED